MLHRYDLPHWTLCQGDGPSPGPCDGLDVPIWDNTTTPVVGDIYQYPANSGTYFEIIFIHDDLNGGPGWIADPIMDGGADEFWKPHTCPCKETWEANSNPIWDSTISFYPGNYVVEWPAGSGNLYITEGAGITGLALQAGAGGFENVTTLQRRLVTKILEISNLIYHRGRFGAGTFMITNGRVASALADVAGYSIAPVPTDMGGVAGNLYPAGKVYGVQVYVDPNLSFGDSRICIGRKGADEEPGLKFMPYIMAESLQTISEGTFSPKIGMKSRYAIEEAGWHPETQYANITIANGDIGMLTGSTKPAS